MSSVDQPGKLSPQAIAECLGAWKRLGSDDHYLALCPAHDDRTPSLDIRRKDDRTLYTCRAGCANKDVHQAVLDRTRAHGLVRTPNPRTKRSTASTPSATPPPYVSELNRRYGVVMHGGRVFVVGEELERGMLRPVFYDPSQLARWYANRRVRRGRGSVDIVEAWMQHPQRRTYAGMEFRPHAQLIRAPNSNHALPDGLMYNLWQGYMVDPRYAGLVDRRAALNGDAEEACARILAHVREVLCSGDVEMADYVLDWLAHAVQRPDERPQVALVFISRQGAGKDTVLGDVMGPLYGVHYFAASRPEDLLGRFNDHLALSVLIVFNEATFGGDRAHGGAIKQLISDRALPMERKFMPRVMVKNCVHLTVLSNESWAMPVELSDRRTVFPAVSAARIGDDAYFSALHAEIETGGREAFLCYLLHRDIGARVLTKLPARQASVRLEHQMRSGTSVERFVLGWLQSGSDRLDLYQLDRKGVQPAMYIHPETGARVEAGDWSGCGVCYRKTDFHAAYLAFCRAHNITRPLELPLLMRETKRCFPGLLSAHRRCLESGGEREHEVDLPPLADARAAVHGSVRGGVAWDEPDDAI